MISMPAQDAVAEGGIGGAMVAGDTGDGARKTIKRILENLLDMRKERGNNTFHISLRCFGVVVQECTGIHHTRIDSCCSPCSAKAVKLFPM